MKTQTQWDSASDWYNQNMGEEGDVMNRDIIRPLVFKKLKDLDNKTLLDVGCGSGYFTAELAKKTKQVVGTDFSPRFVEICTKKYNLISNLSFSLYDVTQKAPFGDNVFDVILSKMVLQYVPKLDTFAQESSRVLKKKGELLILVDHPFNTQFYFAQQAAGKPNPRYGVLNDYFNRSEHTKLSLWNKVMLTWYPKTVGDYIMPFVKVGLTLADIDELPEKKGGIKIPRILSLFFVKN